WLPQIKPFLLSACSIGLGLSWKAGIAAEIIGIPDGSIGEALYNAKVYFNTVDLFSWTVIIVVISILFEKLFMMLLKQMFAGWERL
ncbi:MAG TPA: nitrate ABC transporter permease, partial [Clostridiales bacterium]|nr:nitrate ABC transporter permease [Clostridiales bacterium]